MITNIQIPTICAHGNHAHITYDLDGVPAQFPNAEYGPFFNGVPADYAEHPEYSDLKYLLQQYTHSTWNELKTQL